MKIKSETKYRTKILRGVREPIELTIKIFFDEFCRPTYNFIGKHQRSLKARKKNTSKKREI